MIMEGRESPRAVAGEKQVRQIFRFLDTFRRPDAFLLVDPVMGDDGVPYPFYTASLLEQMRKLTLQADISPFDN